MSASPMARYISENKAIPKRKYINDVSEINGSYSSTPGGTLYSTTPGGTKIVYEKSVLMNLRNSPISKTPPKWEIPCNIQKGSPPNSIAKKNGIPKKSQQNQNHRNKTSKGGDDNEQFQLEM